MLTAALSRLPRATAAVRSSTAVRSFASPPASSPNAFDPATVKKTAEDKKLNYVTYDEPEVRCGGGLLFMSLFDLRRECNILHYYLFMYYLYKRIVYLSN